MLYGRSNSPIRNTQHRPLAAMLLTALLTAVIAFPGCATRGGIAPAGKRVDLHAFAQRAPEAPASAGALDEAEPDAALAAVHDEQIIATDTGPIVQSPEAASSSYRDVDPPARRVLRPGEPYVVDALIGQINGRPIFADAFLAPIEDKLIQDRRRLPDSAFRQEVLRDVVMHLWLLIRGELFLAEAEAHLPAEVQAGLFHIMRDMRERAIAMGGGTRSGAQQWVEERTEAGSIEEFVRGQLDWEISAMLREKIFSRAIVTWRDIQREYMRNIDEFNPRPTLHISRIRVSNDEPEVIEQVTRSLEAGRPFEDIAADLGQGDGAWQTFVVAYGEDGLESIEIAEALKQALLGKRVGETTEPIQLSTTTMWLHLARIEGEGRSLFDLEVQRVIRDRLTAERRRAELNRFLEMLIRKYAVENPQTAHQMELQVRQLLLEAGLTEGMIGPYEHRALVKAFTAFDVLPMVRQLNRIAIERYGQTP